MVWIWIAFVVITLLVWYRRDRGDEDPSKLSVDRALQAARTYDERRRAKR
ncbi:MAG TPA: hypothetical protein VF316_07550 [Polyangiaceae bacterium]